MLPYPSALRLPAFQFQQPSVFVTLLQNLSMSARQGSNPRPADWKSAALPTELLTLNGLRLLPTEIHHHAAMAGLEPATPQVSWKQMGLNHRRTDFQSVALPAELCLQVPGSRYCQRPPGEAKILMLQEKGSNLQRGIMSLCLV